MRSRTAWLRPRSHLPFRLDPVAGSAALARDHEASFLRSSRGSLITRVVHPRLRARFEHEVERRFGRAAEAAESRLLRDGPQSLLAGLRAETEADLL
jgi:hypothetical protein